MERPGVLPEEEEELWYDAEGVEEKHTERRRLEEVHPETISAGGAVTLFEECVDMGEVGRLVQARITEVAPPVAQMGGALQWGVEEAGGLFEQCLGAVARLERRREELVQELLQMEQPMLQEVQTLRSEVTQARSQLCHTLLQRHWLQEDVRQVKRKLFVVSRESIQSQVALATQQYEVAQCALTQEELQSQVLDRIQEVAQLREAHRSQLVALDRLKSRCRPRTMSDLSHCRRASLELGRYARNSMKSLDDWYEPRLLALLRRRQTGEEALRRARELGQDLRAKLGPLREQTQKLELQRACLEQRIALMEGERRESVVQCKEKLSSLEESMPGLKMEVQVQINTNRELKSSLMIRRDFYRECVEGSARPDPLSEAV